VAEEFLGEGKALVKGWGVKAKSTGDVWLRFSVDLNNCVTIAVGDSADIAIQGRLQENDRRYQTSIGNHAGRVFDFWRNWVNLLSRYGTVLGLYQAAQNMSSTHIQCGLCSKMPNELKQQFTHLISTKVASFGAGRPYWARAAKKLGFVDTENGIRFVRRSGL
jgi:hypothetical protein